MKRTKHLTSKQSLIEYCEFLFNKKDDGEFDRGYRYGVDHIKDQLKKSHFKWN